MERRTRLGAGGLSCCISCFVVGSVGLATEVAARYGNSVEKEVSQVLKVLQNHLIPIVGAGEAGYIYTAVFEFYCVRDYRSTGL